MFFWTSFFWDTNLYKYILFWSSKKEEKRNKYISFY
jgi:hypothetical protein